MGNFSDEELKKWLAEEYNKEIDEMGKIMFPDGNIPDDGETEEEARAAYARLVERLKADGIYEEENDSENADDHKEINEKPEEAEKVKIVYLPAKPKKRNRITRVAAAIVVCAMGVFAASMTSQANRSYFIDTVKLWTGNDTNIIIENDENNEKSSMDEDEAIVEIEQKLGVTVPKFMYRPTGFEFKNYNVSEVIGYAWLEYSYKDTIVSIYINDYTDSSKSSDQFLDGETVGTIKENGGETKIKIIRVKDENDEKESYVAYWNQNEIFYQISGKMEKEEFVKLIRKVHL